MPLVIQTRVFNEFKKLDTHISSYPWRRHDHPGPLAGFGCNNKLTAEVPQAFPDAEKPESSATLICTECLLIIKTLY